MSDRQPTLAFTLDRRRTLEYAWYAFSFSYCFVRIYLAQRFIGHHVNIAAFAAVEFASLVPDTIGTCRLVGALVDRDHQTAARWGLVAGAGFIAPDVFVLATARHAPPWLYLVVGLWLVSAVALAYRHLNTAIVEGRADRITA